MHPPRRAHTTIVVFAALLAAAACSLATAGTRKLPGSSGWVYWTHDHVPGFASDSIRKSSFDGSSGILTIVAVPAPFTHDLAWGIAAPSGIAVDSVNHKVYWTTVEWDDDKTPHSVHTVYVMRANTDGTQMETLVQRPDETYADIVLDPVGGKMYWIHNITPSGQIYSANMSDGSDFQIIVPDLNTPTSLAIDLPTRKLYWGLSPQFACIPGKIQRANLDGTEIEDVPIQTKMGPLILGLVVDSKLGLIFWREGCPGNVKVRRANMDGTGVMDLPLGPGNPVGLALDVPNGRLYWGDQASASASVRRSDFAGQYVETVVSLASARPRRIALEVPAPSNPFDLNRDGHVNGMDIAILLGQWSGAKAYAPCPPNQQADLNQDCKINGLDLAMLLGAWAP